MTPGIAREEAPASVVLAREPVVNKIWQKPWEGRRDGLALEGDIEGAKKDRQLNLLIAGLQDVLVGSVPAGLELLAIVDFEREQGLDFVVQMLLQDVTETVDNGLQLCSVVLLHCGLCSIFLQRGHARLEEMVLLDIALHDALLARQLLQVGEEDLLLGRMVVLDLIVPQAGKL